MTEIISFGISALRCLLTCTPVICVSPSRGAGELLPTRSWWFTSPEKGINKVWLRQPYIRMVIRDCLRVFGRSGNLLIVFTIFVLRGLCQASSSPLYLFIYFWLLCFSGFGFGSLRFLAMRSCADLQISQRSSENSNSRGPKPAQTERWVLLITVMGPLGDCLPAKTIRGRRLLESFRFMNSPPNALNT